MYMYLSKYVNSYIRKINIYVCVFRYCLYKLHSAQSANATAYYFLAPSWLLRGKAAM